jgi:hypothetical protein
LEVQFEPKYCAEIKDWGVKSSFRVSQPAFDSKSWFGGDFGHGGAFDAFHLDPGWLAGPAL